MINKHFIVASALMISLGSFAQKDQIKAAEKALKNENPTEALASLGQAESLLSGATEAEKTTPKQGKDQGKASSYPCRNPQLSQ